MSLCKIFFFVFSRRSSDNGFIFELQLKNNSYISHICVFLVRFCFYFCFCFYFYFQIRQTTNSVAERGVFFFCTYILKSYLPFQHLSCMFLDIFLKNQIALEPPKRFVRGFSPRNPLTPLLASLHYSNICNNQHLIVYITKKKSSEYVQHLSDLI